MTRLRLVPLRAYPSVVRHRLRRFLSARRPPPSPDLTDAELDFFFGGTGAVEQRLTDPAFRFFSRDDFSLSESGHLHPPAGAVLYRRPDDLLAHHLDLPGSGPIDLGDPIPWRRDFKTGYEWPREHISRLQLVATKGDVKVPWELSRFQHGITLALGYAATGDERYPREWAAQFRAWRADNPPEFGPNWGSAMEAAIRAVNWIAAYELIRPALDRAAGESVLKSLIQHGRYIASHLEDYWPPTNHLLSNLCGLIWIGLYLRPEVENKNASHEPQRWLDFGLRELARQLRFQILPDGASYEASTSYHRFVTEMVSSTVRLGVLNNVFVSSELRQTVSKMEQVVEGLLKPDGRLPLFGDEDGGKWLPCLHSPKSGEGNEVRGRGWRQFPDAGWFVHSDGDEYLAVRAGDNGQAGWGGHAHNDALSFEYAIGDRTFFVDPGTYAYTGDPEARNLFRSTAYHNTLRVDGQEISRIPPGELFRLENDVSVKFRAQDEVWEGEHDGYRRFRVTHKRRFEKRDESWVIGDTISGEGVHDLEWFFHFGAGCPVRVDGGRMWTEYAEGPNVSLSSDLSSATCELQSGWVSPTYGRRERAPIARYALTTALPVEVQFIFTKH